MELRSEEVGRGVGGDAKEAKRVAATSAIAYFLSNFLVQPQDCPLTYTYEALGFGFWVLGFGFWVVGFWCRERESRAGGGAGAASRKEGGEREGERGRVGRQGSREGRKQGDGDGGRWLGTTRFERWERGKE